MINPCRRSAEGACLAGSFMPGPTSVLPYPRGRSQVTAVPVRGQGQELTQGLFFKYLPG